MSQTETQPHRTSTMTAALLALGIVYGDIGTSPLYAVKETFAPGHGLELNPAVILGGCSTIFWALMIVVSLKYVTLIMRADNRGEGGIMALLALASNSVGDRQALRNVILAAGLFGAALFYGDAVLTPAISVVSAVEGLEVGTSAFRPYIIPITIAVLVGLFSFQRFGTAAVGMCFGPVCLLWFAALGAAGIWNIMQNPAILAALYPRHAALFVTQHGAISFIVLGAVLLAFTGAEALYADMGHFGRRAVRLAWFGVVAPALVLNYFGQGALLLRDPAALQNPFYLAFPGWALYPMVALATAATVIASQATISGAYSITRQGIQLGMLPRMNVVQTSAREYGQIYLPGVNWVLMIAVLAAVVGFGSSTKLAAAYGVSVMGTMLTTTLLMFFISRFRWNVPLLPCLLATGVFLLIDLVFFSASLLKVMQGGWFPLVLGIVIYLLMRTWRQGREALGRELSRTTVPLAEFLPLLLRDPPQRIPGTAIFLTANATVTPHALMHNLNHNKVLHERVVFLTIEFADVPWIAAAERVSCELLSPGFYRLAARYGFMEQPDVMEVMQLAAARGCAFEPMQTSFFVSRQKIVPVERGASGMSIWRDRLFALMARNASDITDYLNIPPNRVVELGTRIEL